MKSFLSGNKISSRHKEVFVTNYADDFFGIEVDSQDLAPIDVYSGNILLLKPFHESDVSSHNKYLIRKHEETFNSTRNAVTIASLRFVDIGEKRAVQVSYGKPEKHFRPERIEIDNVEILGELVEVISYKD